MAENKIYLFGESIARVDNLEDSISSKVYKVGTWRGSSSNTLRTNGFKPNTPASSTIVNTAIVQNNLPAYIISNVMVNRAVRNKLIDIGDLTTDGDVNATANNWISKMGPSGSAIPSFLVDGEVTTQKIASEAVLNNNIAKRSGSYSGIESDRIALDTITGGSKVGEGNIAQNTIHTYNIADNAITTAKIVNLNITTDKLADDAVTTAKINDDQITHLKLQQQVVFGSHSDVASNRTRVNIYPGSISGADIGSKTISNNNIADNAIENSKLKTITTGYSGITQDKIGAEQIYGSNNTTRTHIASRSITSSDIKLLSIVGSGNNADQTQAGDSVIAQNAIGTYNIKDDAVTSAKIADGTIVNANISSSANIESSKIDYSKGISINGWTIATTEDENLVISNGTVKFEFRANGDFDLT